MTLCALALGLGVFLACVFRELIRLKTWISRPLLIRWGFLILLRLASRTSLSFFAFFNFALSIVFSVRD
jgi:hypothetical protein